MLQALRRFRVVVFVVISSLLVPLAYLGLLQASGNFHEVLPGQFYRAAQLSPQYLDAQIKRFGIKTVLNLRGRLDGEKWYRDELKVTEARSVRQIDFGMSPRQRLSRESAVELVKLMRDAAKPILVHCRSGADRTGLATVIYLNQIAGMDEEQAEAQLSMRFGHFGIPLLSPTYAMDESWEDLEQMFGVKDRT